MAVMEPSLMVCFGLYLVPWVILWWHVAILEKLKLWLGAMHMHLHLTEARSPAEASRGRVTGEVRGESSTRVCSLLFTRKRHK